MAAPSDTSFGSKGALASPSAAFRFEGPARIAAGAVGTSNRRHWMAVMRMFGMVAMMAALSTSAQAFDLQGHRGARGLAPENTLPAFALALSIGVTTLELDVAMTKDGILVVHHDEWLNPDIARGPDGRFLGTRGPAIHSLTLDEVKRYDVGRIKPGTGYGAEFPEQRPIDGTRIPTLEEVFALVRRA